MHCVILLVGCVSRLWNPWGALPPTTRTTLQWAETLNGYTLLQSLDDRQQNFRFRPHMVLTMLFSWASRQRNRKNSIFLLFFLSHIFNGWRGKFGINIIIFLEEKKFENINFSTKEYHYDYNGTIMEDRNFLSFLRIENYELTLIQNFLSEIFHEKKLYSFDDNNKNLVGIPFCTVDENVGRDIGRSWGAERVLQILPVSEPGWPFTGARETCIGGTWGSYERSRRWRKATRTCRFLPGGDGVSIREANLPEH